MFGGYYKDRRVFLTGHTGFKGSWFSLWLHHLGARIHGYGLGTPHTAGLHEITGQYSIASETLADIRDSSRLQQAMADFNPEIVFHFAAQPLVRRSYAEPRETFEINVMGTINVLEAIRLAAPGCTVVVITSDKCYDNQETAQPCLETDPLGGRDPYSASKAAVELAVGSWRSSFLGRNSISSPTATARAGNVIGGGDYSEGRIVADLVRAQIAGVPAQVRAPEAVRPWQHVLDCLSGYLLLGARLAGEGAQSPRASSFNFGPVGDGNRRVVDLVSLFFEEWPGEWKDDSALEDPRSEAVRLRLSVEKASTLLGWEPTWDFETAVRETAQWYRRRHEDAAPDREMLALTIDQLDRFQNTAQNRDATWLEKNE